MASLLLVDSHILVRDPLAEYLRDCGHKVAQAANTTQAREFFHHPDYRIDVVLADVNVPDDGGFALANWLHANHPEVRVLLAANPEAAVVKAEQLCDEGPGPRPYDHRQLLDRIHQLQARWDRKRGRLH